MNMNPTLDRTGTAHYGRYLQTALLVAVVFLLTLCIVDQASAITFSGKLDSLGGTFKDALSKFDEMGDGLKAIIGFVAFCVAFVTLAALRTFVPVLFYVGAMIFGAVGLAVGMSILGATI